MINKQEKRFLVILADIEALAVAATAIGQHVSDPDEAEVYQTQILDLITRIASSNTGREKA